jgi:hypothetical protein
MLTPGRLSDMDQTNQPKNETACLSDLNKFLRGLIFGAFIEAIEKLKKRLFWAPNDFVDSVLKIVDCNSW